MRRIGGRKACSAVSAVSAGIGGSSVAAILLCARGLSAGGAVQQHRAGDGGDAGGVDGEQEIVAGLILL